MPLARYRRRRLRGRRSYRRRTFKGRRVVRRRMRANRLMPVPVGRASLPTRRLVWMKFSHTAIRTPGTPADAITFNLTSLTDPLATVGTGVYARAASWNVFYEKYVIRKVRVRLECLPDPAYNMHVAMLPVLDPSNIPGSYDACAMGDGAVVAFLTNIKPGYAVLQRTFDIARVQGEPLGDENEGTLSGTEPTKQVWCHVRFQSDNIANNLSAISYTVRFYALVELFQRIAYH